MAAKSDDNAPGVSGDMLESLEHTLVYQPRSHTGVDQNDDGEGVEETDFITIDMDDIHVEVKASKFEMAAKELLQWKDPTFSDWLDEMDTAGQWKDECPLALDGARKINKSKVTELQANGRLFNDEIKRLLGGEPSISAKEGKRKRTPVYLFLGTSEIGEFKQRLEIACKSFHGIGRNLDAIGQLMESKQAENKQLRQKLKECLDMFESLYGRLGKEVQDILALDPNTPEIIQKHKQLLDDDTCPIVVAGQVSSGKSSLLNLFLSAGGRKVMPSSDGASSDPFTLPVSTLACTGRVCEISYSDNISARLYEDKNDRLINISVNDLSKHVDMYGQEASYKADENIRDVVKLGLPIPFLKGGVTLVDTPGVGENVQDSEIVRNYISKNNVFGFIFTIHTSAGSGVNLKFQQLLRDLSKYKDDNGNKKLDPEAVIFVCNFWDQIKPEERLETTKRVLEILEATGFMKDFDATKQLLFMNSKGAFDTWKVGYMSEDYNRLIDAMERFFEVGHKRKVMQSYVWFHSLLQRVLRSVKFLQFWAQDIGPHTKNAFAEKMEEKLKKINKVHSKEMTRVRHELPKTADKLADKLLTHLKEKKDCVFQFSRNDILLLEADKDNLDIQELKMDMLIDSQIGNLLNKWEAKNKQVLKQKKKLEGVISFVANSFDTRLSEFERRSVSVEKFKEGFEAMDKTKYREAKEKLADPNKRLSIHQETKMDVAFGCTYGNALMKGCSIKQRAALAGASIISDFAKMKRKSAIPLVARRVKGSILQWKSYEEYLQYRASTILSELMHKSVLTQIMLGHLKPVEELVDSVDEAIGTRIRQNEKLIQVMKSELVNIMGTSDKKHSFFEQSSSINNIFSQLLRLGYASELEDVPFGEHSLKKESLKQSCGRYGSVYIAKATSDLTVAGKAIAQNKLLSVKVTQDFITESEQFFLMRHLGKINDDQPLMHAPAILGLAERGYGLVFNGVLTTAKQCFLHMQQNEPLESYRQKLAYFLLALADAIHYLHYKELVHPEVSVESVLVNEKKAPMLSNISEKGSLNIKLKPRDKVGNVIYLPPECVQLPCESEETDKLKTWYTSAGDMYGLGTVMVELYHRSSTLLDKLKAEKYEKWGEHNNPGSAIRFAAKQKKDICFPSDWEAICTQCLEIRPEKRITANKWIAEWVEMKEMAHTKKTGSYMNTDTVTASTIIEQSSTL